MWVFAPNGCFYSVVRKPQDVKKGTLTIRTRNRADIDALVAGYFPDAKPWAIKNSDYAWRIRVKQDEWAHALARMAMEIDYSNYKNRVTDLHGWKRHDVFSRVWGVLLSLRDPVKRPRRRRRDWQDWRDEPLLDWRDGTLTTYDVDRLLGDER